MNLVQHEISGATLASTLKYNDRREQWNLLTLQEFTYLGGGLSALLQVRGRHLTPLPRVTVVKAT
jgi:hypothetical protein